MTPAAPRLHPPAVAHPGSAPNGSNGSNGSVRRRAGSTRPPPPDRSLSARAATTTPAANTETARRGNPNPRTHSGPLRSAPLPSRRAPHGTPPARRQRPLLLTAATRSRPAADAEASGRAGAVPPQHRRFAQVERSRRCPTAAAGFRRS